jgi:hypothetical protein
VKLLRFSQCMFLRKGEDVFNLLDRNPWKPFNELFYGHSGLYILKESSHGYSRASENPGSADLSFSTFDLLTISPIPHIGMLFLSTTNCKHQ